MNMPEQCRDESTEHNENKLKIKLKSSLHCSVLFIVDSVNMSIFETYYFKLALCLTAVLLIIVLYFLNNYTYWLRRNVPYLKPTFPFGTFKALFSGEKHLSVIGQELYNELKSRGCKYGGVYCLQEPLFMPIDPALIKRILSTDFDSFSERGVNFNEKNDPLLAHLFSLPTEKWRQLRQKLTPTFTSGKIKNMFDIIVKQGNKLANVCVEHSHEPIDINDLSVRYTVDIIGCCAFGIDCNSLENPKDSFKQIAHRVSTPPFWNGVRFFLAMIGPNILKYANATIMEKEVIKFFLNVVEQNVRYRETNNIKRNDFFQLLIDMKNKDEVTDVDNGIKMDLRCMAAQTFVFFAAGFETSSMTINFCLYELAQNLQIQDKLRSEIRKVSQEYDGKLTYDGIQSMAYLNCVVEETLRKYPPLGFLNRKCTKNYRIPDTDVTIEKGTKVFISLLGLQKDSDYFPDAEKFDPDRFNDKNKEKLTPFTNMPFGEGHRVCIGERFGLIQTKVGIASLISNLEFTPSSLTKLPITFETQSFVWAFKNPVYLNAKKV